MRKLTIFLLLLAISLMAATHGASQKPASIKTASLESHEGVTITARPWTDPALYKEKFAKNSPYAVGIIALQVAFRNSPYAVGIIALQVAFRPPLPGIKVATPAGFLRKQRRA